MEITFTLYPLMQAEINAAEATGVLGSLGSLKEMFGGK